MGDHPQGVHSRENGNLIRLDPRVKPEDDAFLEDPRIKSEDDAFLGLGSSLRMGSDLLFNG